MKKKICIINLIFVFLLVFTIGCRAKTDASRPGTVTEQSVDAVVEDVAGYSDDVTISETPDFVEHMPLDYATEFSVDTYEGGYASIHITDGNSYVLVPEGATDVILDDENATFIHMPVNSIYLAATAAMDLINELDGLDQIKSCSTKAEDYSMAKVAEAIKSEKIQYVGKYSAPDYERLISLSTDLALESTMIYHSPKIKEELEGLNIPVMVERSSYENSPLGRLEWIKLYGLLLNKSEMANEIFNSQVTHVNDVIEGLDESGNIPPKVVFFYLSSNGYVNVRKPGDYVSKMIETAGGEYALESLKIEEENALSTVNISWEDFYYYGKDADILIYNGTIDGGILAVDDLVKQNEMFSEFKAVKEGRVYCSNNNMFQEVSKVGDIIVELFEIINDKSTELKYIRKID